MKGRGIPCYKDLGMELGTSKRRPNSSLIPSTRALLPGPSLCYPRQILQVNTSRDRYKNKIKPCLQGTELVLRRFLTHYLVSMTRDDRKREGTLCWTISLPGILRGYPCIGQKAAI